VLGFYSNPVCNSGLLLFPILITGTSILAKIVFYMTRPINASQKLKKKFGHESPIKGRFSLDEFPITISAEVV